MQLHRLLRIIENIVFPPKRPGESRLMTVARGLPIILIFTAVGDYIHHTGILSSVEHATLGAYLRVFPLKTPNSIAVEITEDDYRNEFSQLSPLDPTKVKMIIKNIAAANPRLIVVDLDTSSPEFESLRGADFGRVPIVWARVGHAPEELSATGAEIGGAPAREAASQESGHGHKPEVVAGGLLGRPGRDDTPYGFANMIADPDGVVRSYPLKLQVRWAQDHYEDKTAAGGKHDESGDVPAAHSSEDVSLPWRAVLALKPSAQEGSEADENLAIFNFSFDPSRYPHLPSSVVLKKPEQAKPLLADKVVLVGGTFAAARDTHPTQVGPVAGVRLIGMAIESHLQNRVIKHVPEGWMMALDVAVGTGLRFIGTFVPPGRLLLLSFIVLPSCAILSSIAIFRLLSMWLNFFVVYIGVTLDFVHDHLHDDIEVRQELKKAHEEIAALKAELGTSLPHGAEHGTAAPQSGAPAESRPNHAP